jgi:hypothetical protein
MFFFAGAFFCGAEEFCLFAQLVEMLFDLAGWLVIDLIGFFWCT